MSLVLNLARRPQRNERLPALLAGLGLLGLAALSVWHALAVRDLLPRRTAELERDLVAVEQELARLREEAQALRAPQPEAATLARWNLVRELVERRAFSWTAFFARLEDVLPAGVRLVSVAPDVRDGQMYLDVSAIGRGVDDGLAFVRALQASPDFDRVFLGSVTDSERGGEFAYSMRYRRELGAANGGGP